MLYHVTFGGTILPLVGLANSSSAAGFCEKTMHVYVLIVFTSVFTMVPLGSTRVKAAPPVKTFFVVHASLPQDRDV